MSDGFPSRSCAGAILSRGEVVEAGGRFLASAERVNDFETLALGV